MTAPVRTWTLRRRARFAVLGLAVLLLVTGVLAVLGQRQAEQAGERLTDRWMPALLAL